MDSLEPQEIIPIDLKADEVNLSSDIDAQIRRAKTLLAEIEALHIRLCSIRKENVITGIASFRKAVQCELSALKKLSSRVDSESTVHMSKSSNLKFWEGVWSTAKRSNDLVAIRKRICWNSKTPTDNIGPHRTTSPQRRDINPIKTSSERKAVVDIVADGGKTWTKVSMATNNSLLFDLAKLGWNSSGSDCGSDDEDVHLNNDADDDRSVPLLKSVKLLIEASKSFRVRGEHPSVQLVLPRVMRGEIPEIDAILQDCEECGALVLCKNDIILKPSFETSLNAMAKDPILDFTETLNLDCTVLIGLVSDISHTRVVNKPSYHPDIQRQVQSEGQETLLSSLLYPALGNHKLTCTKEAAECMQRIVENTGTSTEKQRTVIFMGYESSKTQTELLKELQQYSIHAVPPNLQLPISIVDQDQDSCQSRLPPSAKRVDDTLSPINKSIFLYGWAAGVTTITSNRRVVQAIESVLERCEGVVEWPSIWLCPVARSLLGEEQHGTSEASQGKGETS